MTDINQVQQAESIVEIDLIHHSGLSPERWRALNDEQKAERVRAFLADGSPSAEAAQGRRRK
ncbi:hypothetical protein [Methylosinus sp. LW4]|uniref:hypothetical protein n=1 Tax=Methylosinus sp. LW4 TaxID=136993 RepID=UPI00037385E5|nr:hypothetical protein [Methylosinus sp. LW4]